MSILIAAVAAVVAGLFVAVAPGRPAHAEPVAFRYCEEHRLPDGRRFVQCWPLDEVLLRLRPTPSPCLSCPPEAIQFRWSLVLPDPAVNEVNVDVLGGLRSLIAGSLTDDPKERDAYRADAWKKYSKAAGSLDKADLTVGEIWRNYKDGAGDPEPQPNRGLFEQYGNETILGLGLLRAALADPDKAPQLESAAHAALDRGAAAFAKGYQSI